MKHVLTKLNLITAALLFCLIFPVISEGAKDTAEPVKAKNVILLVGDGMGMGAMEIGRLLEYGKDGKLNIQSINTVGLMTTNPADGYVTDSAAAGTAMATGVKTYNGGIGVNVDKEPVENMSTYFQNMGKSIGLISTNTVYDATPAAFGSNVSSRSGKSEIVQDFFASKWDVLLGGGTKYFGTKKQDGADMIEEFKNAGYTYVTTADELNAVSESDKLLGLFSPSYMSYKADREETDSTEPSLKEMTMKALETLSNDPEGFFLMSEGARIDHAAHAADATSVWLEMIEFDETVKYCLEWAKENGDTLVIVTADHQTMAITPSESIQVEALKEIPVTAEYMALQFVKNADETAYTTESIIATFDKYAAISLTETEAAELQTRMSVDLYAYKLGWEIGSVIADKYGVGVMNRELRAAGGTGGHSGAWVPVFSEGPGAEVFSGAYDNTDLFHKIISTVE